MDEMEIIKSYSTFYEAANPGRCPCCSQLLPAVKFGQTGFWNLLIRPVTAELRQRAGGRERMKVEFVASRKEVCKRCKLRMCVHPLEDGSGSYYTFGCRRCHAYTAMLDQQGRCPTCLAEAKLNEAAKVPLLYCEMQREQLPCLDPEHSQLIEGIVKAIISDPPNARLLGLLEPEQPGTSSQQFFG